MSQSPDHFWQTYISAGHQESHERQETPDNEQAYDLHPSAELLSLEQYKNVGLGLISKGFDCNDKALMEGGFDALTSLLTIQKLRNAFPVPSTGIVDAAETLGISRNSVYNQLHEVGLEKGDFHKANGQQRELEAVVRKSNVPRAMQRLQKKHAIVPDNGPSQQSR